MALLVFGLPQFACGARHRRGRVAQHKASACNAAFDILLVGDYGGRNTQQRNIAAGMASIASSRNPLAIFGIGDNIYPDGAEGSNELMKQWWRDVYLQYSSLQRPWHPVPGNHDWYSDGRQQLYFTNSSENTG